LFADDGRSCGQAVEDSDRGVRRRRQLDLLQRNDDRLHQILRLGDPASHYQVKYLTSICSFNSIKTHKTCFVW